MIVVTHPTGNANVRAVLDAFYSEGVLERFVTTIAFSRSSHPYLSDHIRGKLRRNYALPDEKIDIHPGREAIRLLAGALRLSQLTQHEVGWASLDQVYRSLDRIAASGLRRNCYGRQVSAVYAYEDCAVQSFETARDLSLGRIYDLPIAYWETAQRLLREEAQRYPDWEPTLGGTRDSEEKLQRKTREIELAEMVICPSRFVLDSIPENVREQKKCFYVPFGSPQVDDVSDRPVASGQKFRVLFAGAMTQRKGLADLFAAVKMISSSAIEFVVMGSLIEPLEWYRERCPGFIYEPPRPHRDFLELMRSCHVFVLPSIVEGRALVQQEAMACGLPVIATVNAGADDVIVDGESGFLVPIRSPRAIAEKLDWCAANREGVVEMGREAQRRARQLTWQQYGLAVARRAATLTNCKSPTP